MKYDISFFMPGIRPNRWHNVYKSIQNSVGKYTFELSICSPHMLPKELEEYKNIKLVRDYGCPSRCYNIAVQMCEGEYLIDVVDDGLFIEGMIEKVVDFYKANDNGKLIVAMTILEDVRLYDRNECLIARHPTISSPNIDSSYYFLPTGIIKNSYLQELGGIDSNFQCTAMSMIDYSIRAQQDGAKVLFFTDRVMNLTHMMGTSGDHGPICLCQTQEDEPLFQKKYRDPNFKAITHIPVDNWKDHESVWHWRFGHNPDPKPKISIFLGGIRPFLWKRYYESIVASVGRHHFELIICGPNPPTEDMLIYKNFKYIRDFGSVSRGAQIAALFSEGQLLTLGADDAIYYPGLLEKAIDFYDSIQDTKKVVTLRYGEGGNLLPESYWMLHNWSHFRLPGIPSDTPMCLNNIIDRKYFELIGGYRCDTFNTCNWGGQDLTIRLKKDGANFYPFKEHIMMCEWAPGTAGKYGDHDPVNEVDNLNLPSSDYVQLCNLYNQVTTTDPKVNFSNWKDAESVWSKRFK